jgi:hypothetical protein
LQDQLELLGTTSPHLLAIGLHTATSTSAVEEWPQLVLPSATIIFFDNNGQQFLSIEDIYISRQHVDGHPLVSPANYDIGDLLFGMLQHFTMTPPTIVATALCRRIMGQVDAG